jgi:hypothetical protein
MKCWILTHIILFQISFNNYGQHVIVRISFSTYLYEVYRALFTMLYRVHLATGGTSVLIGIGCTCSLRSYYPTITTTMAPENSVMTSHNHICLDRNEIIVRCIKLTYNFFNEEGSITGMSLP